MPGKPPAESLLDAAVISNAMYATKRGSGYQGTNTEKLSKCLGKMQSDGLISGDWKVDPTFAATSHYAIFVNDKTKQVFIASRGSSSPIGDWIVNDLGGYLGFSGTRASRTLDACQDDVRDLIERGYNVSGTGHSLGGSVIRLVCSALNISAITFDAPFLKHENDNFNTETRSNNSTEHTNVNMNGDVVNKITSPELYKDSDTQNSISVGSDENLSPLEAHSMDRMLSYLKESKLLLSFQFIPE